MNVKVPQCWICHNGLLNRALFFCWPLRSPDITPSDFFLWGNIKDHVFTLTLPNDLTELRDRIEEAITYITLDFLTKVWEELDFGLDVCQITKNFYKKNYGFYLQFEV